MTSEQFHQELTGICGAYESLAGRMHSLLQDTDCMRRGDMSPDLRSVLMDANVDAHFLVKELQKST